MHAHKLRLMQEDDVLGLEQASPGDLTFRAVLLSREPDYRPASSVLPIAAKAAASGQQNTARSHAAAIASTTAPAHGRHVDVPFCIAPITCGPSMTFHDCGIHGGLSRLCHSAT